MRNYCFYYLFMHNALNKQITNGVKMTTFLGITILIVMNVAGYLVLTKVDKKFKND